MTKLVPRPTLLDDAEAGLLTPGEVADRFRVKKRTVSRWAKAGKLGSVRTLGGHIRYRESEVQALLKELTENRDWGDE